MYEIVSLFNSVIRDQVFSNPFEYIIDNQLTAILMFSLFGSAVLNKIAFRMCGVFYKSRSNKVLGSIGYMFFLLYKCTSTYKTMPMVSKYKFSNFDIYDICNNNVYRTI